MKYVRNIFGLFDPPIVRKLTQPPLLSLSTTFALWHTSSPLSTDVPDGSPFTINLHHRPSAMRKIALLEHWKIAVQGVGNDSIVTVASPIMLYHFTKGQNELNSTFCKLFCEVI